MPNLCLGTAQFGFDYGISNPSGKVELVNVRKILALARQNNIMYLDTAQSYGNAETVIGQALDTQYSVRIISKVRAQSVSSWDSTDKKVWEQDFQSSLKRMRRPAIDALILHKSTDLLHPDRDLLLSWLESLIDRKLVQRIGVSIYESRDLKELPLKRLHLVQLPLSIYDQRLLLDGTIDHLHCLGLKVHARSVFLQGLIVTPVEHWPSFLSSAFREHHQSCLQRLSCQGTSSLNLALAFMRQIDSLEAVLVGVDGLAQLREILQSWNLTNSLVSQDIFSEYAWANTTDLDPRCWPTR